MRDLIWDDASGARVRIEWQVSTGPEGGVLRRRPHTGLSLSGRVHTGVPGAPAGGDATTWSGSLSFPVGHRAASMATAASTPTVFSPSQDWPPAPGHLVDIVGVLPSGETFVQLRGRVDDAPQKASDTEISLAVVDRTDQLSVPVTVPPVMEVMPAIQGSAQRPVGMSTDWLEDLAASEGGWSSHPRPHLRAGAAMTAHGSMMPLRGTLTSAKRASDGALVTPSFFPTLSGLAGRDWAGTIVMDRSFGAPCALYREFPLTLEPGRQSRSTLAAKDGAGGTGLVLECVWDAGVEVIRARFIQAGATVAGSLVQLPREGANQATVHLSGAELTLRVRTPFVAEPAAIRSVAVAFSPPAGWVATELWEFSTGWVGASQAYPCSVDAEWDAPGDTPWWAMRYPCYARHIRSAANMVAGSPGIVASPAATLLDESCPIGVTWWLTTDNLLITADMASLLSAAPVPFTITSTLNLIDLQIDPRAVPAASVDVLYRSPDRELERLVAGETPRASKSVWQADDGLRFDGPVTPDGELEMSLMIEAPDDLDFVDVDPSPTVLLGGSAPWLAALEDSYVAAALYDTADDEAPSVAVPVRASITQITPRLWKADLAVDAPPAGKYVMLEVAADARTRKWLLGRTGLVVRAAGREVWRDFRVSIPTGATSTGVSSIEHDVGWRSWRGVTATDAALRAEVAAEAGSPRPPITVTAHFDPRLELTDVVTVVDEHRTGIISTILVTELTVTSGDGQADVMTISGRPTTASLVDGWSVPADAEPVVGFLDVPAIGWDGNPTSPEEPPPPPPPPPPDPPTPPDPKPDPGTPVSRGRCTGLLHRQIDGLTPTVRTLANGMVGELRWATHSDSSGVLNAAGQEVLDEVHATLAAEGWLGRLRLFAGQYAPADVKALAGGPVTFAKNEPGSTGTYTFPRWWEPAVLSAYRVWAASIASYLAGLPRFVEVTLAEPTTQYAEPMVRQIFTSDNGPNLLAAGYSWEADLASLEESARIHRDVFTPLGVSTITAVNPIMTYLPGKPTGTASLDLTWRAWDSIRAILGDWAILQNNSLACDSAGVQLREGLYPELYSGMAARHRAIGQQLGIQTAAEGFSPSDDLAGILTYAARLGVAAVEVPVTWTSVAGAGTPALTAAEAAAWTAKLAANSIPAGKRL